MDKRQTNVQSTWTHDKLIHATVKRSTATNLSTIPNSTEMGMDTTSTLSNQRLSRRVRTEFGHAGTPAHSLTPHKASCGANPVGTTRGRVAGAASPEHGPRKAWALFPPRFLAPPPTPAPVEPVLFVFEKRERSKQTTLESSC